MRVIRRLAAYWLVILVSLLVAPAPAAAQETAVEYQSALTGVHSSMNELTLELERFVVNSRYCKPPQIPSKAEAQAELDALAARVKALNARYVALKAGLTALAGVSGPGGYMMAGDADPTSVAYWRSYEAARRRMTGALGRKQAALAAAPEVDCQPKPKPAPPPPVTTGGFQPPLLPVRPSADASAYPALPPHFCSQDEYWKFQIEVINPVYNKAAEDAEQAARFRSEVEQAVNAYVQNDRPVPADLTARRRQAIADVEAASRRMRETEDLRNRARAIPVIDCGRDRRTGMSDSDFRKIEGQQSYIGEAEGMIAEIDRLRRAGRCREIYLLDDRLRGFLNMMGRIVVDGRDPQRRPAFPKETIDDLRRRANAALEPCPPVGVQPPPRQSANLDELRKAYRAAAQGSDQAAFRAAQEKLLKGLDEAIATETRDAQSDQLIRERGEVRTAAPPGPGILDDIGQAPADPRMRTILDAHNKERAVYGLPGLRWDAQLATGAMTYAHELARTGQRVHSSREGRGAVRENLNQGMLGWSAGQMVQNWLREKTNFMPGTYPAVTRTGRWQDVSHYTQMIWPATTQIGCGLASGSGYQWLVCRYSPGGNKDGQPVGLPSR